MSKKNPFTEDQILVLQQNKFTHFVTPHHIKFTLDFKQFFIEQVEQGKTTPTILKEAGYDLTYFSRGTMDGIRKRILHEAKSETGLKAPKGLSTEERILAFEKKDLSKQKAEASIREMQERIVQLEKQVAFLKKISHLI